MRRLQFVRVCIVGHFGKLCLDGAASRMEIHG